LNPLYPKGWDTEEGRVNDDPGKYCKGGRYGEVTYGDPGRVGRFGSSKDETAPVLTAHIRVINKEIRVCIFVKLIVRR